MIHRDNGRSAGLPPRESRSLFRLALLAALEIFIAGIVTLLISPDPKNAFLFGFSPLRVVLVVGIWVLAGLFLAAGWLARRRSLSLDSIWLTNRHPLLKNSVYALSFLLILWGWLALIASPDLFGRRIYIFQRIQPVSVALGVVLAQCWIVYLYSGGRFDFHGEAREALQRYLRPALLFTAALLALEIFILATKFGLLSNIIYANVPGIPLAGLQWFLIVLAGVLWIALIWPLDANSPFMTFVHKYKLIPGLIFLAALLTWGLTPMVRHFFSLLPATPDYQPFPFSDARIYDEGGISILRGYGVYFHVMIDKPLYMIVLAALHGIAGPDYNLLIWLQLFLLSFIPVVLYSLGRGFHSTALGVCLALTVIVRQRNAIVLSYKVSTTNPKLLMAEEITLLVMILLVYLAFRWVRERRLWQAVLCGTIIGAASLIRLNPLFLFPTLAALVIPLFWRQGKKILFRHVAAYSLAFIIVLLPWLIGSVDPQGNPWLLTKIRLVVQQRYGNATPPPNPVGTPILPSGAVVPTATAIPLPKFIRTPSGDFIPILPAASTNLPGGTARRFFYHLLHNYSTSIMALPMSLVYTDLDQMSQRTYWQDTGEWTGDLTPVELGFILINSLLVALGLAYAWKQFRWAGMVPLVIYLGYDISLGFAMNSGGRYLVPIDWVIYFYYFLAVIALARFGLCQITGRQGTESTLVEMVASVNPKVERRALGVSAGWMVFLALLFPLANSVIPAFHSSALEQPEVREAVITIGGREPPGTTIIYGEILYPYFTEGRLLFDLITPAGATSYLVPDPGDVVDQIHDEEYAFIALRPDSNGTVRIESIYFWQDQVPVQVWRFQP